ncbi:MAG TPA: potassium/proton antiporter [Gemmatimonadaceae bacterium]|nr:potassium/proton antiporter [Gemmatimonadaceae bacterium]
MPLAEPMPTALLLTTFGALLAVSILTSRATERFSVPVALIFLLIGVLAGWEGIGGIDFENYRFAFRLGAIALVLILFDGGLNTPLAQVRQHILPAGILATFGVIGTAAILALGAHVLGMTWPQAALLGAIVSSTDAAAVFSVMRRSGIQLKRRVGVTLEVESGINDPMAVILTTTLTAALTQPAGLDWVHLGLEVVLEMVIGAVLGIAIGMLGRFVLTSIRLPAGGLYPALSLAIACLAFGVPTMLNGSGFLAVYVAAVIIGNARLPYRPGLVRVHDSLAWLSQIAMFLVLGLLVVPSRLPEVAMLGLGVALFLAVVARPLVVAVCLAPFRYPLKEVLYIGWVGLRGAVPIILATFPVLAAAPGAERIFDIVFFVVVANAFVPGSTVAWVTRKLGLESRDPPAPKAVIEIESLQPLNGELLSFYIDHALAVAGVALAELPFPDGTAVTMLVRGHDLVAPRGSTVLMAGDHIYVFTRPEDRPFLQLLFGRPEGDE